MSNKQRKLTNFTTAVGFKIKLCC